jgi:hypothetical protein
MDYEEEKKRGTEVRMLTCTRKAKLNKQKKQ